MSPFSRQAPGSTGQASVELVAVVPALLLVGLALWQLALAGYALWACANAARVAARAAAVGDDPRAAARSALPGWLRRDVRVAARDGGTVRVRISVPLLGPWGPRPVRVSSSAALAAGAPP
jgi:pilus assembly protein CpaE